MTFMPPMSTKGRSFENVTPFSKAIELDNAVLPCFRAALAAIAHDLVIASENFRDLFANARQSYRLE
jgi:hypothetical protein